MNDAQAAQIEAQAAQIKLHEGTIDLLQNELFELRKGKDAQIAISDLLGKIEALKEKLVEERAHVLAGKSNLIWEPLPDDDRPDRLYPALTIRGKEYWRAEAREQLKIEMPEVDWEVKSCQ